MAATTGKHINYNAKVVVNAVDLSTRVKSVEWVVGTNKHMGSAMQEIQDYSIPGTILVEPIKVTFYQDYNTSQVYQNLRALWVGRTTFTLIVNPDSGADGATNPGWNCLVFVGQMPFLSVERGEVNLAPVTFEPAGEVTFDVTP